MTGCRLTFVFGPSVLTKRRVSQVIFHDSGVVWGSGGWGSSRSEPEPGPRVNPPGPTKRTVCKTRNAVKGPGATRTNLSPQGPRQSA